MRLLRCGRTGLLVELDDLAAVRALHAAVTAEPPAGVVDMVPAARTLLLHLDPAVADPSQVAAAVRRARPVPGADPTGPTVEIPVRYDGPDLGEVAAHLGMGAEEVVARHTAAEWAVAFCGFAPGFGYLVRPDPGWRVPRRQTPRTRVPAGSVGLAGEFTGVYPRDSPGGWQLIGRTEVATFVPDRDPPALLAPGTRVRFRRER